MASYTIKLNRSQAMYLRRLLEEKVNGEGPDTDGYYSVRCDEGDDAVYLTEHDMDSLFAEVDLKTRE